MATSPSRSGWNTAASAAAISAMPSSRRNRAAAVTPASASKLGMPVSSRDGPASPEAVSLYGRMLRSSSGSTYMAAACGPYHL